MYLMVVTFSIISLAMSVHHEVTMFVSGSGQDTYILKVRFSTQQFDKFSSCLTDGKNTKCTVKYSSQYLPQPNVTSTQATGSWPDPNSKCKFYKCKSKLSNEAIVCTQQTPLPVFSLRNQNYQVLNLANISSGLEACVTFIWDFISEGLNYSNQFSGSQNCWSVCFSSSTTITTTTTPPSAVTSPSSSPSSSSAAATTTTEVSTKLSATTHVQMYENSSQVLGLSSEAPQHYDHSTDNMSPVIAAVIAVVIITIIILIIVAFVFWRRRKQMSHTSKTLHNYVNVSDYRGTKSDLQPENECASGTRGDNLMKHVVREAKPMRNRYIDSQVISTTQGEMGQINIGELSTTFGGGAALIKTSNAHLLPEIWTAKSAKAASVDEENTSKESKEYVNNLNEMTNIINDYTRHTKSSGTTRNGKVKNYDSCYDLNDTDNEKTKSNSNTESEIPAADNMSGSKITEDWIEASKNDYDYIDNDQRETKLKIVSDQDSDYSECRDVSCRTSSDTSVLEGSSHLGTMYKKADDSLVQKDCSDVYDVCKIDSSSEGESRSFSDATVEDSYNATDGVISLINANYKSKNAYSRLGDHVRNITNPYDVLPDPHDDSSQGPCPFTSETQKREFIYSVAGSCVEVDEAGKPKSESTEKDIKMNIRKNTPTYSAVRKVKSGNIVHTKAVQRSEYTDSHSALSELSTEPKGPVEDIPENAVKANETNIYSEL